MELHLSTPEAVFLAHELADRIGKPEEELKAALLDILQSPPVSNGKHMRKKGELAAEIMEIGRRCAALPDYDTRTPDEILGYDELGLPT